MSARLGFWLLGIVTAAVASYAVNQDAFPAARVVTASGILLSIGFAGEVFEVRRARNQAIQALDDREADGQVEIAPIQGVMRALNPEDERFGAFLGIEAGFQPIREAVRATSRRRSPPLLGKVAVVSLFLGRDGQSWSENELAAAHQAILRACLWVETQAIRYRAKVNLVVADAYFLHDDENEEEVEIGFYSEGDRIELFDRNAAMKALSRASRAALALGFTDASDLYSQINARLDVNESAWLIHPRQSGRSFALPHEISAWDGLSLANCYPAEANLPSQIYGEPRVDPITVVHELLHLFGATDKYGRSLTSFRQGTVTGNEVMRLDERRLSRLRIDPLTARELGWPSLAE